MSVLKRRMFNRGGMVTSRGTGITSGLVRGYQEGGSVTNDDTQRRTLTDFQRESKSLFLLMSLAGRAAA